MAAAYEIASIAAYARADEAGGDLAGAFGGMVGALRAPAAARKLAPHSHAGGYTRTIVASDSLDSRGQKECFFGAFRAAACRGGGRNVTERTA